MKTTIIIAFLFTMFNLLAENPKEEEQVQNESKPYKIYEGTKVQEGIAIKYEQGTIKLQPNAGGAWLNIQPNKVSHIDSPIPQQVKFVIERVLSGRYKDVVSIMKTPQGQTLLEQQNFCGWGKRLTAYYAYALIQEGDLEEMRKVLRLTSGAVPGQNDALDRQLLKVMDIAQDVSSKKFNGVRAKLNELVEKMAEEVKPFFYNLEGDLLVSEDKKQEALLAYYKVVLLDKTNPWQRNYAKSKIVEIYKSTGDSRADLVKSIK